MAKRSARKARSGGVSRVLERTLGAEYRIGGWGIDRRTGPEPDQCCPLGEAIPAAVDARTASPTAL